MTAMKEKTDFYKVLGLAKNADEKEIKKAFRQLAKKYHPDTNQGNAAAEQKFKEVNEAYDILSNPVKKRLYDQYGMLACEMNFDEDLLKKQSYYQKAGNDSFEDLFDNLFRYGKTSNRSQTSGTRAGYGPSYTSGFGYGPDFSSDSFRHTSYTSSIPEVHADLELSFEDAALGCDKIIQLEGNDSRMQVHIPAGIDDGQSLRLKNEKINLVISIHVQPHHSFTRKGPDIYLTENIPFTTAALGGKVRFRTLHGNVEFDLPAGTQSGKKIRLRGMGTANPKKPGSFGDQYVTIQIKVPKNMTPEERAAVEALELAQSRRRHRKAS